MKYPSPVSQGIFLHICIIKWLSVTGCSLYIHKYHIRTGITVYHVVSSSLLLAVPKTPCPLIRSSACFFFLFVCYCILKVLIKSSPMPPIVMSKQIVCFYDSNTFCRDFVEAYFFLIYVTIQPIFAKLHDTRAFSILQTESYTALRKSVLCKKLIVCTLLDNVSVLHDRNHMRHS